MAINRTSEWLATQLEGTPAFAQLPPTARDGERPAFSRLAAVEVAVNVYPRVVEQIRLLEHAYANHRLMLERDRLHPAPIPVGDAMQVEGARQNNPLTIAEEQVRVQRATLRTQIVQAFDGNENLLLSPQEKEAVQTLISDLAMHEGRRMGNAWLQSGIKLMRAYPQWQGNHNVTAPNAPFIPMLPMPRQLPSPDL